MNSSLNPSRPLFLGYVVLTFSAVFLWRFVDLSGYFSWGPPFNYMGKSITSTPIFYGLLLLTAIHQAINNWCSLVVYPYILTQIQNPAGRLTYSSRQSLSLSVFYDIYCLFDSLIFINAILSQVSFFFAIILSTVLTTTILNWSHIKRKEGEEDKVSQLLKNEVSAV